MSVLRRLSLLLAGTAAAAVMLAWATLLAWLLSLIVSWMVILGGLGLLAVGAFVLYIYEDPTSPTNGRRRDWAERWDPADDYRAPADLFDPDVIDWQSGRRIDLDGAA